jgi:hypothetical protein
MFKVDVSDVGAPAHAVQKSLGRVAALLALTCALACGERADARDEARALMTSLNAVSDEGSFTQRSAALSRLSQLELHFAPHVQTREVCSAAHKGLLEAEVAQAQARRALSEVSQNGAAQPLAQNQAETIAADIERSNKALATAKDRFPECERAMRSLVREAR